MEQFIEIAETIRILAIAPYEGMRSLIEKTARSYPEVQLTAFTGNLEEGVRLAQENFHANYDVIISRGGTAGLLREQVDIPVIEVPIGMLDILKAIRLSDGMGGKKAVVGFASITGNAATLKDLLQLDIDIYTIQEAADAADVMMKLREEKYSTVICDVISSAAARDADLPAILITSGTESIREAIDNAINETNARRSLIAENRFLRTILREHSGHTAVFTEDGTLYFSSVEADDAIIGILRELLEDVRNGVSSRYMKTLNGYLYTIKASQIRTSKNALVAYYFERSKAGGFSRTSGIAYYSRSELEEEFLNAFSRLSDHAETLNAVISALQESPAPVVILGAYGTGRTETANMIYLRSRNSRHSLIEIDCEMLNERSRDFLLNSQRSPLCASGNTLHFKNLEANNSRFMKELFFTLTHMNVCDNNTVIFSCDPKARGMAEHLNYLKDKYQCLEIELQPLKDNLENIPAIASLYLSHLSATRSVSILRIDPAAMDLLSAYTWPGNYTQFERILTQLSLTSNDHLIHAGAVRDLLMLEQYSFEEAGGVSDEINLHRSLSDISSEIIDRTLKECGGNKAKAARKLGISRTTLWRMGK